jgi:hypothetical protein
VIAVERIRLWPQEIDYGGYYYPYPWPGWPYGPYYDPYYFGPRPYGWWW